MTQPYSIIVSSTSAFSIRILSLRRALGQSNSSRVYFWKLHHALRMHPPVDLDGQAGIVVDVPSYVLYTTTCCSSVTHHVRMRKNIVRTLGGYHVASRRWIYLFLGISYILLSLSYNSPILSHPFPILLQSYSIVL